MSQLKRIPQKTKKACPKSHTVFELFCWQTSVLFVMCKCTVSSFVVAGSLILRHKVGSVRIWGCSSCDFDIGPCCQQKFQDRKIPCALCWNLLFERIFLKKGNMIWIVILTSWHGPGSWIYAELADFLVPTGIPRRGGFWDLVMLVPCLAMVDE